MVKNRIKRKLPAKMNTMPCGHKGCNARYESRALLVLHRIRKHNSKIK